MTNTPDFTAPFKDMMAALPYEPAAMEDMMKSFATLNEKLSAVAVDSAAKSVDLSADFAKSTLTKMTDVAKAKTQPADYAQTMTDVATAQAEAMTQNMMAFAEIAKTAQANTMELIMSASKDLTQDASAAASKTVKKATATAKKAA